MKKHSSAVLTTRQSVPPRDGFSPTTTERNYPDNSYQSFNTTHVNTLADGDPIAEQFGYEGGIISPVDDDGIDTTLSKESSLHIFKKMASSKAWSSIATFNVNLDISQIQKYSSGNSFGLKKDLRFSTIDKKYDLFYFNFSNIKKEDIKYCIANSLSSAKPISTGFISGVSSSDLIEIGKFGFSRSASVLSEDVFFIRKNDLNKISSVNVFSSDNSKKVEFLCDVAETIEEKISGLQPYQSLKYGAGLIFPYKRPQDVMYHMGSVSFPIDIIFIGSNNKIKKIEKNILPGTLATFGSSDVSAVLEISGGSSNNIGLMVGDTVSIKKPSDDVVEKFSKLQNNFSSSSNLFIKNSSFTRKISFGTFDIFNVGGDLIKTSEFIKTASSNTYAKQKKVLSVYNFDRFLTSDFGRIRASEGNFISCNNFISNSIKNFKNINISKSASLSDFLAIKSFTPFEIRRAFLMIKDDLSKGNKVVVATELNGDMNILKALIVKRASEEVIFDHKIHSIDIISAPMSSFISNNNEFLERFSADSLSYKDVSLDKFAGGQIPDNVKENASVAVEVLSEAKELLEQILSDFKNNSEQYIKVKDKVDFVKKSGDKYQTSCTRLSKKIVKFLLKIKKTIKIMNSIKDISSVDEKIESVSLACKEFSDIAEETFEIVRIIEDPNFVNELVAKTSKIEKSIEDVDINIRNFSDYILKNILNKKVLSR